MSSSKNDVESTEGTSSITLPEGNNRWHWESCTSSSEESPPTSQTSRSEDKLIGSPGFSPISNDSSIHADFDQVTLIPFNENEVGEDNSNFNNQQNTSKEQSSATSKLKESVRLSDLSDADSEAPLMTDNKELTHLKKMVKKLRSEIESERDTVTHLRKKHTQINKDKLGQTCQFNDEMSLLRYENVALQARVEEQAVHTEQLEYELTKARKKNKQDVSYSEQRESQDVKQIEDLKSRLAETQSKLKKLEEEHSTVKQERAVELHNLKTELDSTNSQLTKAREEIEITRTENGKLTEFIKEQEKILKEMLEKIQSIEIELNSANAEKSKTAEELNAQQALTEEQGALLQEMQEKCKELADQLEKVKLLFNESQQTVDSLESKSVQLECALNSEKATSGELRSTIEHTRRQLTELEDTHGRQCRELSESGHTLNRNEQELSNLKKQLMMEKDDKRDLVSKLKKQLDVHQEHVNKLKTELSATCKHQKYLEEISQKIVNDLQPVFSGFPTETGEINTDISVSSLATASEERTRNVFDTLHNTVSGYKKRLTSLADEKTKAKAQCDSLTKESAAYKEMLYKKETEYDECKSKLADAVRDMDRVSRESTEVEARCATMTVDVGSARAHNHTLQSQCQALNHELLQAKARHDKDSDEKHLYLQHIYHLLTSDLDLTSILQGQPLSQDKFTWNELSTTVSERLASLLNEATHLKEKVARLDSTLTKNESYLEGMREEHSFKISDMSAGQAAAIERSSEQWREERTRLEDHYTNLMSENQNRQQRSQRNAEEAWDKLRDSDETNHTLESQNMEVQEKITLLEQRQRSLLCALALITGSYFPLLSRSRQLKEQRTLLMQQVSRFDAFKSQVSSLLQTLALDIPLSPLCTPRESPYARLRFRKAVLVVLAMHRLQRVAKRSTICVRDDENQSRLVCWATSDCTASTSAAGDAAEGEGRLVQWLCHIDLESVANLCTKDTLEAMDKIHDGSAQHGNLRSVVSSSLSKMVRQLSTLYKMDDLALRSHHKHSYYASTLSVQLLNGLQSSLARSQVEDRLSVMPATSVVTRLQERVLNFVQQLHSSESERKRLKETVESLNETLQQLKQYQEACTNLEDELHCSRKQMEKLVPIVKLEDMMSQLQEALERERQAQALLSEQNLQVKELTRRLNNELSDRDHTDNSVKFAMKTLHDELDSKVTLVDKLSRQVSSLQGERQSLHDHIYDAENALKTAAQDRQTLANYVETLITAFNKCRDSDGGTADLTRVMLSGELIPCGHPSPHLLSVQKLAHEFVEAYTSLQAKVAALSTVTTEQLHEMNRLKQELSLVCTGQQSYVQHNNNQVYQYPSSGYGSSISPLKVASDHSSVRPSPAVYDMGLMTRSLPSHSNHRSSLSHQPFSVTSSPVRPLHISPCLMSSSRGTPSPRLEMHGNIRK